ncbi:MAG: acetyl-coenzyme A synthetase N-terminal domain-containing protein, partial [Planctomycetota bacterium]
MIETPLWKPDPSRAAETRMAALMKQRGCTTYEELHRWSVSRKEDFWSQVWDDCGVRGEKKGPVLVAADRMPGAKWFPEARLNFAENLLRDPDDGEAIVFWGEDRVKRRLTRRELHALV